ncbi:MAG: dicarboxylate/amino acid:cation symporter [Bdellovibrionota bacterium]
MTQKETRTTHILYGLIAGILLGFLFNAWGENVVRDSLLKYVIEPVGQVFLRGLFMVVVPLVFCSLASSIGGLGSFSRLGKLGWRLGLYYLITTLIAVVIGQFLVTYFQPGAAVPQDLLMESKEALASQVSSLVERSSQVNRSIWPGIIEMLIPKNIFSALVEGQMLAIIFSAIVFGGALLSVGSKSKNTFDVLEGISEACIKIVSWIMRLAPYAVAALMISSLSKFGVTLMKQLGAYVMVVCAGYLIQFFITYGCIVRFVIGMSFKDFLKKAGPAIATAFGTSSSNATIPASIRTLETNFGVSKELASFTVPLGATVNMDGTALFEAVAILFVAQIFGVELTLMNQVTMTALVLLTSIGVAGVPGASIPLILSIMATFGIPPEGIALVLGVDRLLDMGRTILNVTGDLTACLYINKVSLKKLKRA